MRKAISSLVESINCTIEKWHGSTGVIPTTVSQKTDMKEFLRYVEVNVNRRPHN